MGTLFEDARRHVEAAVRELEGEQDFLPFLAVKTHRDDVLCVGIVMPETAAEKDLVADTMTAVCLLHRATEAAFASAAWMVEGIDGKVPDLPPSQCANRQEIVFLNMVDAEGKTRMHTATMVRENNMAGVGVWEQQPDTMSASGRFLDAIRIGMGMGRKIPPDLGEFFDNEVAEGGEERLIEMMVRTIRQAKKEVFGNE